MAFASDVADALVTALQAAGFTEAERRPIPYTTREDCADRKCVVIIRNLEYPAAKRQTFDDIVELAIILQKAMNPSDNDEHDALLDDVETLVALWQDGGALENATLNGAQLDDDPAHPTGNVNEPHILNQDTLFHSVLAVRYKRENH